MNWELYQSEEDKLTSKLTSDQQATNKQKIKKSRQRTIKRPVITIKKYSNYQDKQTEEKPQKSQLFLLFLLWLHFR